MVSGDVGGELAAVGAFGFELGFGAFGAGAFGVGEGALCFDLGVAAVTEGFAFAGGVVPGSLGFRAGVGFGLACVAGLGVGCGARVAGSGEGLVAFALEAGCVVAVRLYLLACAVLGVGDLPGGVAAELAELGGQGAGGFLGVAGGVPGGCLAVAGGGERPGLGLGFCLAVCRGGCGCLGAPAGECVRNSV